MKPVRKGLQRSIIHRCHPLSVRKFREPDSVQQLQIFRLHVPAVKRRVVRKAKHLWVETDDQVQTLPPVAARPVLPSIHATPTQRACACQSYAKAFLCSMPHAPETQPIEHT